MNRYEKVYEQAREKVDITVITKLRRKSIDGGK
jgi:hypothetical protein